MQQAREGPEQRVGERFGEDQVARRGEGGERDRQRLLRAVRDQDLIRPGLESRASGPGRPGVAMGLQPGVREIAQEARQVLAPRKVQERPRDLAVLRHLAGQRRFRAQLARHLLGPLAKALVLVGQRDLGAFAPGDFRDAVGDGAIGEEPGDEDVLAGEQRHRPIILSPPCVSPLACS